MVPGPRPGQLSVIRRCLPGLFFSIEQASAPQPRSTRLSKPAKRPSNVCSIAGTLAVRLKALTFGRSVSSSMFPHGTDKRVVAFPAATRFLLYAM